MIATEAELVGLALALGAERLGPLTPPERKVAKAAAPVARAVVTAARATIARGDDPLGDAFSTLRSPLERRPMGATYTPRAIVSTMVAWGAQRQPARVVDPGAGSGRFIVAAGRALPSAQLVAVEIDPIASLLSRAHLVAAGLGARAEVIVRDYRRLALPTIPGRTLFLGNPPYVRHHAIPARWKRWLSRAAAQRGLRASQLAGLHVHFFLATALEGHARDGDSGAFVTAAEWLDVNYGSLVRELTGALGGESVHVLAATALPFQDADTTAAITCFTVGTLPPELRLREVASPGELGSLDAGSAVPREILAGAPAGPRSRGHRSRVPPGSSSSASSVGFTADRSPARTRFGSRARTARDSCRTRFFFRV